MRVIYTRPGGPGKAVVAAVALCILAGTFAQPVAAQFQNKRLLSNSSTGHYIMGKDQWAASERAVKIGDFDGDGRDDLLLQGLFYGGEIDDDTCVDVDIDGDGEGDFESCAQEGERNTLLLFGQSNGTFTSKRTVSTSFGMAIRQWAASQRMAHVGDFNGDGRDDILLQGKKNTNNTLLLYGTSNRNFTNKQTITNNYGMVMNDWASTERAVFVADFNGDGKDDILLQGKKNTNNSYVLFGNSSGTNAQYAFRTRDRISDDYGMSKNDWAQTERIVRIGDYDGDGRADILLQGNATSNNTHILYGKSDRTFTARKTISGLYGMAKDQWAESERYARVADYDGDGRSDVILQGRQTSNNTLVLYGTYNDGFTSKRTISGSYGMAKDQWANSERTLRPSDYDGDGKADVLLQGDQNTNNTLFLYGQGGDSFSYRKTISNSFGMDKNDWAESERLSHAGDFNGDGKTDVLLQGRQKTNNTILMLGRTKPLSVSISGPTSRTPGQSGTWSANVSGGSGSTSYTWKKGSTTIGSSSSVSTSSYSSFTIYLTVTKGGETKSASRYVSVSSGPDPCFYSVDGSDAEAGQAKYVIIEPCPLAYQTAPLPETYALNGAYPNPATTQATLALDLPESAAVRVAVYDLMGRSVVRAVETTLSAGRHEVPVDVSRLPVGAYVYRVTANDFVATGRMTVVR